MTTTPFWFGGVAAAALVLVSDYAAANMRYTAPGATCRATTSSTVGTNSRGWFVTSSTARKSVHCPIMRDFTSDPMTALFMRIQDSNDSSGTPWCTAYSYEREGTFFDETEVVTHDNPGGFDSMSINVADLELPNNYAVNVLCQISKNDAILSYRYIEG